MSDYMNKDDLYYKGIIDLVQYIIGPPDFHTPTNPTRHSDFFKMRKNKRRNSNLIWEPVPPSKISIYLPQVVRLVVKAASNLTVVQSIGFAYMGQPAASPNLNEITSDCQIESIIRIFALNGRWWPGSYEVFEKNRIEMSKAETGQTYY